MSVTTPVGFASGALESVARFQGPMEALVRRVKDVDLRPYEAADCTRCWQELHPVALALVQEAQSLMASVISACEAQAPHWEPELEVAELPEPHLSFERALDVAVEAGRASIRAVEDVAFLVSIELRQRYDRLHRITASAGVVVMVGECDSALRRIRKGLGAVDIAIARAEQVPVRLDFSSELEESLEVRGTYARFRSRILADGQPSPQQLYARMRAVGTQMAMLVGNKAYPLLRVRDRLQLRELQHRILSWLLPENRGDPVAGLRIWQDVVAFVEMLSQVNQRQELMEHDAQCVTELQRLVGLGDATLEPEQRTKLRPLWGLHPALDAFIDQQAPVPRQPLREVLDTLAQQLGLRGP